MSAVLTAADMRGDATGLNATASLMRPEGAWGDIEAHIAQALHWRAADQRNPNLLSRLGGAGLPLPEERRLGRRDAAFRKKRENASP